MFTKIPFGYEVDTDSLIDVGSVERGQACSVICPSCGMPLVAKQGEVNVWHYAHDPSNRSNTTLTTCEYAYEVSVRSMIKQMAIKDMSLALPYWKEVIHLVDGLESNLNPSSIATITHSSNVVLKQNRLGHRLGEADLDVFGDIGSGYNLGIFLSYQGRKLPQSLKELIDKNTGVIEIRIDELRETFANSERGLHTDVLRKALSETVIGKYWVYHPRRNAIYQEVKERLREKTYGSYRGPLNEIDVRRYQCLTCSSEWTGQSNYCKVCKGYIYSIAID